ncbi:arginine--tRNA ligase [Sphingobacteriales bacterium UPWRP_1]|nr:arginine--tRNA ligase [Sphingobacteriales bacterium TSM_CSM]PSJ78518.1 arginine--tRNA ligase [Sphingobacteriales bacterium UPWRP_1]
MSIEQTLQQLTAQAVQHLYKTEIDPKSVTINETPKNFTGSFTVVIFPYVKIARKNPLQTGTEIGSYLKENLPVIEDFNVVQGFVNLVLGNDFWLREFTRLANNPHFGQLPASGKKIVLEYIGPNTNKPLHLGHIRNMFVGHAVAAILQANGHEVHKVNIYNDKGINISKSMAAWTLSANGATPHGTGMKGDHFVGYYYVLYNKIAIQQAAPWIEQGMERIEAEKNTEIYALAQRYTQQWEQGNPEVLQLWRTMNSWVYQGFKETFEQLGITYEKAYYESECYELGKEMALNGLAQNVFFKQPDGSVWVDLTDSNLDQKILIRSDGTSVYITQDMGVAELRYNDYKPHQMIYVVGDEQIYHFKVLKLTLEKLGKPYADTIFHLYYGMVDLPEGKMKSREGKVVDADDLIAEMLQTAEDHTKELGKTEGMNPDEARRLYRILGIGALKYFILKVNAQKRVLFNPQESVDFQGNTGPFIQYSFARISSILRKFGQDYILPQYQVENLHPLEKDLIAELLKYEQVLKTAADTLDPSVVANYAFGVAKTFNKLYAELSVMNNPNPHTNTFRVALSAVAASIIKKALYLLGIDVPQRM